MRERPTNIEEFRSLEPEESTARSPAVPADDDDTRVQKATRMRRRYSKILFDEAYRRTRESGKKVFEADLLDEALTAWIKKNKLDR